MAKPQVTIQLKKDINIRVPKEPIKPKSRHVVNKKPVLSPFNHEISTRQVSREETPKIIPTEPARPTHNLVAGEQWVEKSGKHRKVLIISVVEKPPTISFVSKDALDAGDMCVTWTMTHESFKSKLRPGQ
jgi:hypothetical protein